MEKSSIIVSLTTENKALKEENSALRLENEQLKEQNNALLKITNSQPPSAIDLPAEILHLILSRAIPPNSLLDSSLTPGPNSPWARTLELKKNLTLVSHFWNKVATCFLYQDITIRRFPQLLSLFHTLQRNRRLANLVKSLELRCYIPELNAKYAEQLLLDLMHKCDSLVEFSYTSPCRFPMRDLSLPSSITKLYLGTLVDFDLTVKIVAESQNNLEYLHLFLPIFSDLSSPPSIVLPALHTLWIELPHHRVHGLTTLINWSYPSLLRLTLSKNYETSSSYSLLNSHWPSLPEHTDLKKFIYTHGGTLKFLAVELYEYAIQSLVDACPLLERFVWISETEDVVDNHQRLRCIDYVVPKVSQSGGGKRMRYGTNLPNLMFKRTWGGFPVHSYSWIFHPEVDSTEDCNLKIDIFHHQLTKTLNYFNFEVLPSTPRPKGTGEPFAILDSSDEEVDGDDIPDKDFIQDSDDEGSVSVSGDEFSDEDNLNRGMDADCDFFDHTETGFDHGLDVSKD